MIAFLQKIGTALNPLNYDETSRLIIFASFVAGALFTALMAWIWSFFL